MKKMLIFAFALAASVACGDKADPTDSGGDGTDSADGADGTDGTDGADGADGTDGADGGDGTDGTGVESGLPDCEAAAGHATDLNAISISGDTLNASVSYSGGCETHSFRLCWPDPSFMESAPVQAALEIIHEGPEDPCDAYPTESVDLDLTPMKDSWQAAYGASSGEMLLHVSTTNGTQSVTYSF